MTPKRGGKMKKRLVVIFVLLMVVTGLFAQQAGQFSVGSRLGPSFGFNNSGDFVDLLKLTLIAEDPFLANMISISNERLTNFNFVLYGAYTIIDNLSLQAELNFMINQGYKIETTMLGLSLGSTKITYSSLDIPILLKYTFVNNPALFGILAGPHISIPLGKAKISGFGMSEKFNIENFATFGLTAGIFGGYQIGPGRILADLRFVFDFNALEEKEEVITIEFMKRRALSLTAGYEISF
ncbi:MAG: PorT family protein [Spirochaetaceae bacterium]|nr:PorT family protein [Spirochaetaceae bacterium]